MKGARTTHIFKSGNGQAVRLPKGLGFGIGTEVTIERRGDALVLRAAPDAEAARVDVEAVRAAHRQLIRDLRAIGAPPGGV